MYYKFGEIKNKIISFNGFEFKVSAMKNMTVSVYKSRI